MRLSGHITYASMLGLFLCMVPLVAAVRYALCPSERLLALMRPLTVGAVFAAVCTFVLALANGSVDISMMSSFDPPSIRSVAAVFTERLAPVMASFASLAVAWFFVAIGMQRS